MASPIIEVGPRCMLNFCVFCVPDSLGKILEILKENKRHYVFEKPSNMKLYKITLRCNITNACVIWKLIGYLTTDAKV